MSRDSRWGRTWEYSLSEIDKRILLVTRFPAVLVRSLGCMIRNSLQSYRSRRRVMVTPNQKHLLSPFAHFAAAHALFSEESRASMLGSTTRDATGKPDSDRVYCNCAVAHSAAAGEVFPAAG